MIHGEATIFMSLFRTENVSLLIRWVRMKESANQSVRYESVLLLLTSQKSLC